MRPKFTRLSVAFLALILATSTAEATLVLALYNGTNLYVGSDSLEMGLSNVLTNDSPKIRSPIPGCCFSTVGLSRVTAQCRTGTNVLTFAIPQALEDAFRKTEDPSASISERITNAVAALQTSYKKFRADIIHSKEADDPETTTFTFWSFERSLNAFTGLGCRVNGIQPPEFRRTYDGRTQAWNVFIQGQEAFLSSFLRDHTKFPNIQMSAAGKKTWNTTLRHQPITETQAVDELLELFLLHQKHAEELGMADLPVSEPFVIWRVTTNSATKLGDYFPSKTPEKFTPHPHH